MSMIGAYARVTPAELDRALTDPAWAAERLVDLAESTCPGQDSAGTDRYVDVDKAWNGIWFLLNAADTRWTWWVAVLRSVTRISATAPPAT